MSLRDIDNETIISGCIITTVGLFMLTVIALSSCWDYTTCGKKLAHAKTSADSSYIIKERSCDLYVRMN